VTSAAAAYRADGGDGPLVVRAASVAGVRHRLAGGAGEDAYAWRAGEGWVFAAVADGVSATEGAALASASAVDAASAAGADVLTRAEELAKGAAAACRAAVGAADRAVRDATRSGPAGATTLVVAAVTGEGDWSLLRVGDSTAFVLVGSGAWTEAFPATGDGGGVADTATAALPADEAATEQANGHLEAGEALFLVTDGVAGPLRDGPETVVPAFAAALAAPPPPLDLALLADFSRQGCHDDRTVVGIWRPS
jgi:serine/threonine protein phosphatase PrpC